MRANVEITEMPEKGQAGDSLGRLLERVKVGRHARRKE
jgi:uncharacterized protein YggU (UPF0235/DUF167 family)